MSNSRALDAEAELPRGGLTAWLVCLSAGLFFFYEFFQLNIFDVINKPLRHDFHLNATTLSWMSSLFLWADILFLLPAGVLLDRYSPRLIICLSMLLCVVSTFGFALTSSFILASFCHFLAGIGNAFCFLACVVLITRWFPTRRHALLVGLVVTMAFLGGMTAHTPFAHLVDLHGWRYALLIDACVGLFLWGWIFLTVKDAPLTIRGPSSKTPFNLFTNLRQALQNRQTWLGGIYTAFLNLPIMVLCALWGATYLQTVHQLNEIAASNTVSLIFVGSIIGCPLAGFLSDRLGRRKPLMIAGALATLSALIPLFITTHLSASFLHGLFFALGFFSSAQVIAYPLITESNAPAITGVATGIASIVIMGTGGLGQVLFGWLMQNGKSLVNYTSADFQSAMWIFPLTTFLGLVAVLFSRETYCKHLNERSMHANG